MLASKFSVSASESVIAGPAANFENNVRIDKGGSSGLAVDMIVVTEAGLELQ